MWAALGCARLTGSTTFKENVAYWGGAIYNTDRDGTGFVASVSDLPVSVTTFPDDTVFEGNFADVRWSPVRSSTIVEGEENMQLVVHFSGRDEIGE